VTGEEDFVVCIPTTRGLGKGGGNLLEEVREITSHALESKKTTLAETRPQRTSPKSNLLPDVKNGGGGEEGKVKRRRQTKDWQTKRASRVPRVLKAIVNTRKKTVRSDLPILSCDREGRERRKKGGIGRKDKVIGGFESH